MTDKWILAVWLVVAQTWICPPSFAIPQGGRAAAPPSQETAIRTEAEQADPIWERIVAIGASATDGFGLQRALGQEVDLGFFLERSLRKPHQEVLTVASSMFFLEPEAHGQNAIRQALDHDPTLVFALDYLFWYLYGSDKPEEERLESLELGLANLARLKCPVIITDIPDMRASIGYMLFEAQVPTPKTLELANKRLRNWATERKNVHVVSLIAFLDKIRSGKTVEVGAIRYGDSPADRLIQWDKLHPTVEGTAALLFLGLHTLLQAKEELDRQAFLLDPRQVANHVRRDCGIEPPPDPTRKPPGSPIVRPASDATDG